MRHSVGAQKGFTIIELTVVLVAGVIIAAVGAVAAKGAFDWLKAWQITNQIETVQQAATSRYADSGVYTGISKDELKQYLPSDWEWTNVYGGNVDVAAGTEKYQYQISEANVPENVGERLADKYPDNSVYDSGSGKITFTFES